MTTGERSRSTGYRRSILLRSICTPSPKPRPGRTPGSTTSSKRSTSGDRRSSALPRRTFGDVLVLVDPTDYAAALEALRRDAGPEPAFRFGLAQKAFRYTAAYDRTIAGTLAGDPRIGRRLRAGSAGGAAADTANVDALAHEAQGAPVRRESASGSGLVRRAWRGRSERGGGLARQGPLLHEPARPRRGGAPRARVRRADGCGLEAHESMRCGDRGIDRRGLPAVPARPTPGRPSVASSVSTGHSMPRRPPRSRHRSSRRSSRRALMRRHVRFFRRSRRCG